MKYGYYEFNESPSSIEEYIEGSHIIVLRKVKDFFKNTCILEDIGWEVRDSIKVITETESFNATLFRKPFKGTVANNILENGCGGINIGISRISHTDPDIIRKTFESPLGMEHCARNRNGERGAGPSPEGRFPSNLILIHGNGKGDCPVKKLDAQSGITTAVKTKKSDNRVENNNQVFGKGLGLHNPENSYKDSGGASRYFKQVHSLEELKEYLVALIRC